VDALDFVEHFTSCLHCYHSHYMSSVHDWHGEDFGEKRHDFCREIRVNRVHFAALHFCVVKPVVINSLRAGQDLMRHAGGGPSHLQVLCAPPPKHRVALPPCSSNAFLALPLEALSGSAPRTGYNDSDAALELIGSRCAAAAVCHNADMCLLSDFHQIYLKLCVTRRRGDTFIAMQNGDPPMTGCVWNLLQLRSAR
jgi:hypothetical protein